MKRLFIISSLSLSLILFLSTGDLAQGTAAADVFNQGLQTTATQAGIDQLAGSPETLSERVGTIVNYLFGIVGTIFLIMVIFGGFVWMTAGGSDEKVGKANKIINNATLGLIFIFLAYALVYATLLVLAQATKLQTG